MTWFWMPLVHVPQLNEQSRLVGWCPAGQNVAHELNEGPSSSQMTWFWMPLLHVPQLNEQSRLVAW